ncbi:MULTISPECIES: hypothetical protein [unclassified Beijerinckia]|uniref:hypothetical protein n=1 Tax=unclassified Beijerinckia TaxID=2638183 RepID=UPI0008951230|nr:MULTISPECIES: hypothetical protein [unclassified Beijerinckia]MDH7794106.1 hypothetical protein [Beijerinckia sp. GAS462]SEB53440.1 hypothetical protein SAMN05443249_0372 [Beijerinckia sp. 28-YEA-48]
MPRKRAAVAAAPTQDRVPLDPATQGLSPLDVMLRAMREHAARGDWDTAAALAKDVAPYMHPKLASLQHSGADGGPIQTLDLSHATEEQLAALEQLFGPIVQDFEQDLAFAEVGDGRGEGGTGASGSRETE